MRSHDLLGWAHVLFQCYLDTPPRPLFLSKKSVGKLVTPLLSQPFNKHMKEYGPSVSVLGSFYRYLSSAEHGGAHSRMAPSPTQTSMMATWALGVFKCWGCNIHPSLISRHGEFEKVDCYRYFFYGHSLSSFNKLINSTWIDQFVSFLSNQGRNYGGCTFW